MKRTSLYFVALISAFGCKRSAQSEQSAPASISIGEVDQGELPNDSFRLVVESKDGPKTYSTNEELAATTFEVGEEVKLSMELLNAGEIVAKTIDGNSLCSAVTETLKSGNNPIRVPICKVDKAGQPTGSAVSTDGEPPTISVEPCIVDKGGCDDVKPDITDPAKDPVAGSGVAPLGACKKENENFKTANGGCMFVPTGLVVSATSNLNGQLKSVLLKDAKAHCEALSESGFDDWRIPRTADFKQMDGLDVSDFINSLSGGANDWAFVEENKLVRMGKPSTTSSSDFSRTFCVRGVK